MSNKSHVNLATSSGRNEVPRLVARRWLTKPWRMWLRLYRAILARPKTKEALEDWIHK